VPLFGKNDSFCDLKSAEKGKMQNREENIWDVEKVISYDRKRKLYRVRWAGFPKDEDTEEPIGEFANLHRHFIKIRAT
jgi:hypothetical protein